MTTRPDEWHWPELPDLLEQWRALYHKHYTSPPIVQNEFLARRAADWQLEQVCAWLSPRLANPELVQALKNAMRPAPPVTAATALAALDVVDRPNGFVWADKCQQIRSALLRLQQFEQEAGK